MNRLAMLCAVLTLSACSLLPTPPTLTTYALPALKTAMRTQTPHPWSLRVNTPSTITLLNAQQLIVEHANASLAAYRGVRWADRAPVLLRNRMVQYLNDSQLFAAVVSDRSTNINSDLELSLTLHKFQLVQASAYTHVAIVLDVQFVDTRHAQFLGHQTLTQQQVVSNPSDPDAVITAFGHATDALAQDLSVWIARLTPKETP